MHHLMLLTKLEMFFLKSDEHLLKIGKELYEDDTFSDLTFVTEGSTFHGHSSLIFSQLPALAELVCHGCKYGHQKMVIILPGVDPNIMETALMEFYIKGDLTNLGSILNVIDVQTQQNISRISENTNDIDTSMHSDKTFNNTTANTHDFVESELNKFGEHDFESAVNVTDFVNGDGHFDANNSKSHEEFNFNNCILFQEITMAFV